MGSFRNKNKKKQARAAAEKNGEAKPEEKKDNKLMNYVKVVKLENEEFEKYYKFQKLCESEEEHATFMAHCRTALPTGLRVNGVQNQHTQIVKEQFHGLLSLPEKPVEEKNDEEKTTDSPKNEVKTEEEKKESKLANAYVLKPKILEWYPNELAMQFNYLDAKSIKKDENFKFLKQFLMNRETYGAIQRQETVSMIPPIFLDVQPDDLVLDMCAAPGSKTCQLLEMIHWSKREENKFGLSEGAIVANDVEWKRANMLQHQVSRIGSPGSAVLNTDAKYFAALKREDGSQLQFDKVLADVPCSGDGTVRKTPNIWRTWAINDGMGLHFLQLQILIRGFALLKPGGKLVYSTCSLNPMENEAVVHAALLKLGKSVKVVAPPELPGMVCRQGKTSWGVCHPQNSDERFEKPSDVPEQLVSDGKIRTTMFCPGAQEDSVYRSGTEGHNEERKDESLLYTREEVLEQLPNCRRFLPHLMNTGGFFVTVLEKVNDAVPSTRDEKRKNWDGVEKKRAEPPRKKAKMLDGSASPTLKAEDAEKESGAKGEDRKKSKEESTNANAALKDGLVHFNKENADWLEIQKFYELDEAACDYLCKRPKVNGDARIYAMSKKLKEAMDIILHQNSTKAIACGVRTFERLGNFGGCSWRITQEGIPLLLALGMKRRVLKVSSEFFEYCLRTRDMLTWAMVGKDNIAPFEDNGKPKDAKALQAEENANKPNVPKLGPSELPKLVNSEKKVEQGTYLMHCEESDLYAVVLITQKNFTLYVDKHTAQALTHCMGVKADLQEQMGLK